MYRVIFKHRIKTTDSAAFTKEWQASSDIIQKENGALGSRLFKLYDAQSTNESLYVAMADWDTKDSRNAAMKAIKDRGIAIESHMSYVLLTDIEEYELVGESLPR